MDLSSLLSRFLESSHGQAAASALAAQGYGNDEVTQILNDSVSAGAAHLSEAHQAPGHQTGLSFFAAFASSIVKGDGIRGSLEDGAVGVIEGRIVALLTAHMGIGSAAATAAAAAAAATAPYVLAFLKQHLHL